MVFLNFILLPLLTFSSAPANEIIKHPPLKVTWDKEVSPVFVGIEGEQGFDVKQKKSITLKRVKYAGQETALVLIPKDSKKTPFKLIVPDTLNEFHVAKELLNGVQQDELWLWGQTHKSKCGGYTSLSLRFLDKKGLYKNILGLFVWKISKQALPKTPAFYILPTLSVDLPSTVRSLSFINAPKSYTKKCELHIGGECPYVFSINSSVFGMSSRISFVGNTNSVKDYGCPI